MGATAEAVLIGMLVMIAGTIPRNLIFAANLRYYQSVPWAVPVTAVYLVCFWRYLQGAGPPPSTAEHRRNGLRATGVPGRVWAWALLAGGLGIVALVLGLRIANRLVVLPPQQLPDLTQVPRATVLALLLMAAPVAGVVEEAAFRGYMQGPIERQYGLMVAILVTGTMFAVAHLDFTPILWPYYVAVAAIYGTVTYLTRSILPAVVLHTSGNLSLRTSICGSTGRRSGRPRRVRPRSSGRPAPMRRSGCRALPSSPSRPSTACQFSSLQAPPDGHGRMPPMAWLLKRDRSRRSVMQFAAATAMLACVRCSSDWRSPTRRARKKNGP